MVRMRKTARISTGGIGPKFVWKPEEVRDERDNIPNHLVKLLHSLKEEREFLEWDAPNDAAQYLIDTLPGIWKQRAMEARNKFTYFDNVLGTTTVDYGRLTADLFTQWATDDDEIIAELNKQVAAAQDEIDAELGKEFEFDHKSKAKARKEELKIEKEEDPKEEEEEEEEEEELEEDPEKVPLGDEPGETKAKPLEINSEEDEDLHGVEPEELSEKPLEISSSDEE